MDLLKIVGSLGVGALGMWFMYKLCEKILNQVVASIIQMNKTMASFVIEQHQEHKQIIKSIEKLIKLK
tara:strand:- start:122 stop:325 length:204 start_codon:yes stop_codon:yes gene_type:complete